MNTIRLGIVILFLSVLSGGCGGKQANSTLDTVDNLNALESNMESQNDQDVLESANTPTTSTMGTQVGTNWSQTPPVPAERGPSEAPMSNSVTPMKNSTTTNTTQ